MHLQRVQVRGFRNISNLDVSFHPGLNVLVGANSIGKSNLFAAIRLAMGPSATQPDTVWPDADDRARSGGGEISDSWSVSLEFAGLSEAQMARYFEILDFNSNRPEESLARVHFEATWDRNKGRHQISRWGGKLNGDRPDVPAEILASLPVTFLPALRDAEAQLSPGRSSRVARMLAQITASLPSPDAAKEEVLSIYNEANESLLQHELVRTGNHKLSLHAHRMAGIDFVHPTIAASAADYDRILRSLQVLLNGSAVPSLSSSGLGYNNLLYIATVLAQLRDSPEDEVPLLLIEEPEAHLHPQMVRRLAVYLDSAIGQTSPPQTLVASHSPVLASHVSPDRVVVFHRGTEGAQGICRSLRDLGITGSAGRKLRRMLDMTRASMYFARGVILVEGPSEELLVPELAKRCGVDLADRQVEVVPVHGVDFATLAQILGPQGLGVPASILTDGDPEKSPPHPWPQVNVKRGPDGKPVTGERAARTLRILDGHETVKPFVSSVTLEYDLALPAQGNAVFMAQAWEALNPRSRVLKKADVEKAGDETEAALLVWRGICLSSTSISKVEFAHELADQLRESEDVEFEVPIYIRKAVEWAASATANGIADASATDA